MPKNKIQPATEGENILSEPSQAKSQEGRRNSPSNSFEKAMTTKKNEQVITESDGFCSSRSTASMIQVLAAQLKKPEPPRKKPKNRFYSALTRAFSYIFFNYMSEFIEKGRFFCFKKTNDI